MTNIRRILENNGFEVTKERDGYSLQQYTPAGEDWNLYFEKLTDIKSYAEGFDPEEEFEIWVEAKIHGYPTMRASIPCYSELWQDQLWKQELLDKIATEIK